MKDKAEEAKQTEPEKELSTSFQRFKKTRTWAFIEILSPIVAIIGGIVLPIVLYIYSEKTGQVTIRGVQQTSLINAKSGLGNDVSIIYRDNKIADLVSYTFDITNTGNTDIDKADIHYFRWVPPRQLKSWTRVSSVRPGTVVNF